MFQIDEIDLKILDLLQKNGRIKRNDLAQMVGLSVPSVSERMKKLEESGIIKGYTTLLDSKKLGKDITAFIFVYIDSSKNYPLFIERVMELEEILECHSITGEGSHLLKVKTENTSTLEKLLARIQSWPGVTGTRTSIVLSTIKETTRIKIFEQD
ncbi:MAG: Lrp/AsnC family transcriptional regulator [Candidatus Kryptonium sp.]